jgi:hypothetical protein
MGTNLSHVLPVWRASEANTVAVLMASTMNFTVILPTTRTGIVVVGHADEVVDFSTVLVRQLDVMAVGWRLLLTI